MIVVISPYGKIYYNRGEVERDIITEKYWLKNNGMDTSEELRQLTELLGEFDIIEIRTIAVNQQVEPVTGQLTGVGLG